MILHQAQLAFARLRRLLEPPTPLRYGAVPLVYAVALALVVLPTAALFGR